MVAGACGPDTVLTEAEEESASLLHKVNIERHAIHTGCNVT